MKKLIAAIALAVALPTAAHAQASQAPAKDAQMKPMCPCCKDMMSGAGHGQSSGAGQQGMGAGHAGHDMSQQGAKAPPAAPQNRKR